MKIGRTLFLLGAAAFLASPSLAQQQSATELTLFKAVAQEADPVRKLALLTEWREKFPGTVYTRERNLHYLSCYSQLEAAAFTPSASPESVSLGERAATVIITHADELFSPQLVPENMSATSWSRARADAIRQAHFTLAAAAYSRKASQRGNGALDK